MRTGWAMPRSGAIVVEVRVRERLLRRRMCVQRLNSRCAHNSIASPSWTRIDYGICPDWHDGRHGPQSPANGATPSYLHVSGPKSIDVRLADCPVHPSLHGQDGDRSQRRDRYDLYITASLSCRGRAVNGRESVPDAGQRSAFRCGCARMMHYPREMTRRRVTPAGSAGDRGLTEAWGRLETRPYGDSVNPEIQAPSVAG